MLPGMAQFFSEEGGGAVYDSLVEYVESNGTNYVDTGVAATSSCGFSVRTKIQTVTEGEFPVICGYESSDYSVWLTAYAYYIAGGSIVSASTQAISCDASADLVLDIGINYLDSYNIVVSSGGTNICQTPDLAGSHIGLPGATICLFCAGTESGPMDFSVSRIYEAKISVGSVIVKDLVPVRIGTTGYLYDQISGSILQTLGTGALACGPDVTS